ncbi:transcriptional regulation of mitochondrial recombination domain-containing protein [Rutstroemia sp. NJR-2017a BBW]|nr:transcriptional regulation of mitochondrial recombination domain-containing protein [Rutstroemia sp. NJR-2017a BBW]
MSVRSFSDAARNCMNGSTARGVRYASSVAANKSGRPEHGEQIYVYNHLQTNQVVYSLTKSLKNNASLAQLPYNGKKTVPAALRKDHWSPLALITFPPGTSAAGLTAYQKLREYRKLHELSWDPSSPVFQDKDGKPLNRILRGRKLNDQKANSVADIAAVLESIREGNEKIGLKGIGEGKNVEVKWRDLNDAEWAEKWSEAVVHDVWEWRENNREPEKVRPYDRMIAKHAEEETQSAAAAAEEQKQQQQEQQQQPTEQKEPAVGEETVTQWQWETDGKTPEERKREKRIQHLALMERLKGTHQSYTPRGKWKHESAPAPAPTPTSAASEPAPPKPTKAERHAAHLALMASLKGTQQVYPNRGKNANRTPYEAPKKKKSAPAAAEESAAEVPVAATVPTPALSKKAERHARHVALMESLRGTQQVYPPGEKAERRRAKMES